MRTLLLLLLAAGSAFPQLSVGLKAGVPMTDFFDTVRSPNFGFNSNTKRYIIGPTVELHLPAGFAVEVDALYRRLNYSSSGTLEGQSIESSTTGNSWEFPILLKYRFGTPVIKPFIDAGVSFNTLSGLKQTVTNTLGLSQQTSTSSDNPAELQHDNTIGFVIGAGLDVHAIFLHISPEIRYTRWGNQQFRDARGFLTSSQNQAEFLVGFTF